MDLLLRSILKAGLTMLLLVLDLKRKYFLFPGLYEIIKNPFNICRSGSCFRMKLHRYKWERCMFDALVAPIIGVEKPGLEARRNFANSEAMILCGHIAAL